MNNSNSPISDGFPKIYEYKPEVTPKPSKVSGLWFILNMIFLVFFNVFFFLLGELPHNASVWVSYGFIHFAYFMLLATPLLVKRGKSSVVFGFALFTVSSFYFAIALIVGIVIILIAPKGYTAALLVQLSIAGVYGMMLIAHMLANEHTAEAEEKRQYEISYVKSATVQLKGILNRVKDDEAAKKVERAYDAVNSSPIKSHPNLAQMEHRVLTLIDELDDAVAKSDKPKIISAADSLFTAVNERNNRLRSYQAL